MTDADPLRLELELDPAAWPVPVGRLRGAAGAEHPFTGYLAFAAALDAVAREDPRVTADP